MKQALIPAIALLLSGSSVYASVQLPPPSVYASGDEEENNTNKNKGDKNEKTESTDKSFVQNLKKLIFHKKLTLLKFSF